MHSPAGVGDEPLRRRRRRDLKRMFGVGGNKSGCNAVPLVPGCPEGSVA